MSTEAPRRHGWQPITADTPHDRPLLLFNPVTGEQAVCSWMTSAVDGSSGWVMARGTDEEGRQIAFLFRDPSHWRDCPDAPAGVH